MYYQFNSKFERDELISIVLTYMNTSLTDTSVVFTRILGQRICQHRFRFRIKGDVFS
jgi:hypothetical protein